MSVASVADVEVSLRRTLVDGEQKWVNALLDRAEALIVMRVPDLLDRVSQDPAFATAVAAVEGESVARVLRSPNNGIYRSETQGNYTYQLNMQVASGLLDILPAEWERLGVSAGGVGTVMPETDGYVRSRYGSRLDPADEFQLGWPGRGYPSRTWLGGYP